MPTTVETRNEQLRREAVERLEKRAAFWPHLTAYVLINVVLVGVWFLFADGGLFWPVFPMVGWGIGVFFHARDTFRRPVDEARIQREMDRLATRGQRPRPWSHP